mgnify:CR=1 FL=1
MIAQGDFRKLLLADTEERSNIFRKLFHTDIYKVIQEKLKFEDWRSGQSVQRAAEKYPSVYGTGQIFYRRSVGTTVVIDGEEWL